MAFRTKIRALPALWNSSAMNPPGFAIQDLFLDLFEHEAAFHGEANPLLNPQELVAMESAVSLDGVLLNLKAMS
ncbi:MAG: hypothetical protein NZ651_07010 [Candidatus Bipolaricaulota bacterium]|nr:hypothetical protein [Candidatus Bipolaricaulota bacterium]MDW8127502.1 hypothetical protein [Candidatus Bipolaricaulota bacterium]